MLKRRYFPVPGISPPLQHHCGWDWENIRDAGIPPTQGGKHMIIPQTVFSSIVTGKDTCDRAGDGVGGSPCPRTPSEWPSALTKQVEGSIPTTRLVEEKWGYT